MNKRITATISSLFAALVATAQAAFVSADSVAVFYPAGYDATQHEPSLIFDQQHWLSISCRLTGSCALDSV